MFNASNGNQSNQDEINSDQTQNNPDLVSFPADDEEIKFNIDPALAAAHEEKVKALLRAWGEQKITHEELNERTAQLIQEQNKLNSAPANNLTSTTTSSLKPTSQDSPKPTS